MLVPALLCLPALAAPVRPAPALMEVRVDRRFELMSIVFRLADYFEYRMGAIEDYNAAVDTHFGPFKDHAAVRLARELREEVGYSAIPNLALRARDARGFRPALALRAPATGLDSAWKPGTAEKLLEAMGTFAKDTQAEAFFAAQAPLYRKLEDSARKGIVQRLDPVWFKETFGAPGHDTFTLCVAPLNGGANYGPSVPNAQGGMDRFAILGTAPADKGEVPWYDHGAYMPILIHELLHSFINPWVERHMDQLQASGETLNAPVVSIMRRQAYGDAETALKESMVRAFTTRYFLEHGNPELAAESAGMDTQGGFYWVKPLADFLGRHARKDGDLEALTPQLVAAFRALAARSGELSATAAAAEKVRLEKLYEVGPKLVAMEPADGATGVDPATKTFRITFDRPMSGTRALVRVGEPYPTFEGKPVWDRENRVLTFSMRLEPGTAYKFMLNADQFPGFKDQKGFPMRPRVVSFTTR